MAFKHRRWTLANILPLVFVVWVISTIWFVYVSCHLLPLWSDKQPDAQRRGHWQGMVFQILSLLVFVCFGRAVMTDPGSAPPFSEWEKEKLGDTVARLEVKQTGAARFCKWCDTYKPDRCHHCRACGSCILRMDHHCPWIANCIGFHNHKYFLLLILYSLVTCLFVSFTMASTAWRVGDTERSGLQRFVLIFGMTLCVIVDVVLLAFCSLHGYFLCRAVTTIEFCEKACRPNPSRVSYDRGLLENLRSALGQNMLLWLLPLGGPAGDGMRFDKP